jgi:transposase-like protein
MKKVVRLSESDLNRIVKKVLRDSNLLNEETKEEFVEKIYQDIISAVKTFGWTNKQKVYDSFKKLRTYSEFLKLYHKFKDKRTGYDSLKNMLEGEYDLSDFEDLEKLRNLFIEKFAVYFSFKKEDFDLSIKFRYFPPLQENEKVPNIKFCKKNYETLLDESKKFWKDWLSNSETKRKFKRNYMMVGEKIDDSLVSVIFAKYQKIIDESYLYYYFDDKSPSYAYVKEGVNNRINVNCALYDPDKKGTLIHEMQHLLYFFKPLNPEQQIEQLFVNKTTKRLKPDDVINNITTKIEQRQKYLQTVSKEMSIPNHILEDWYIQAQNETKDDDPEYVCRETEKMSNIFSVRNLLAIKPGQNITTDQLKPYIEQKKSHTDVDWILLCWALNGFEDLNKFLYKLNNLAQKEFEKTNSNNIDMSQSGVDKA